jgi:hypothetical protein
VRACVLIPLSPFDDLVVAVTVRAFDRDGAPEPDGRAVAELALTLFEIATIAAIVRLTCRLPKQTLGVPEREPGMVDGWRSSVFAGRTRCTGISR